MILSQEAQALANAAIPEEIAVTQEEKDALYNLVMKKKAAPATGMTVPLRAVEPRRRRIKPAYLIAACIAAAALIGAGYAASAYFDKIYHRGADIDPEYNIATDNPELLVELPPFASQDPAAATSAPIIELEKLGRLHLGPVFAGRSAGEVFDVELQAGDKKAAAQGLAGTGLSLLSMVTDDGVPRMELIVNRGETQKVLDRMVADGRFLVTLELPGFAPVEYMDHSLYQSLHYSDDKGASIGINLSPHFRASGEMPQTIYDGAKPEDLTLNGNHFVLMRVGESYMADLYLGDYSDTVSATASISFGSAARDRDRVMEILGAVKVHNPEANRLVIADRAFFAAFPQGGVRENASIIADAIRTGSGDEGAAVWESDGVVVNSSQDGWEFTITSRHGFDSAAPAPLGGQGTAITEQHWFDKEIFTATSATCRGTALVETTHTSGDVGYTLVSAVVDTGYAHTPLDAVIARAGSGDRLLKVEKMVNPTSANPIVVMSGADEYVSVFSARKLAEGGYLVQEFTMPRGDLPGELS